MTILLGLQAISNRRQWVEGGRWGPGLGWPRHPTGLQIFFIPQLNNFCWFSSVIWQYLQSNHIPWPSWFYSWKSLTSSNIGVGDKFWSFIFIRSDSSVPTFYLFICLYNPQKVGSCLWRWLPVACLCNKQPCGSLWKVLRGCPRRKATHHSNYFRVSLLCQTASAYCNVVHQFIKSGALVFFHFKIR